MLSKAFQKANIYLNPGKLYFGPEWLVLGVNNICNLHCKMCDVGTGYENSNFYHHLVGAKPLNMPLELIYQIIDQAAVHFPRVKLGYAFTEPIIYPHLLESLERAKERGLFTSMTTNALKLRKMASELTQAGLSELYVSLDGPRDIHNEIRGNKNSFDWALEGMELIWEQPEPRPKVAIFCTITEWNIGRLREFLTVFKGKPLKLAGFMHTNFTPQSLADYHNTQFGELYPATASNMEGITLENMDLKLLWQEMQAILAEDWGFPVSFSPHLTSYEDLVEFYQKPETKVGKVCNDAFRTIMIKSDGSVIPAHGRCYDVVAGNLYQQNLKEIWNSEILGNFRKALMKEGGLLPACSRCCSAF